MTFLTEEDMRRLGTELAVANTASYVFRRFRNDPMVRALAMREPSALIEVLKQADLAGPAQRC